MKLTTFLFYDFRMKYLPRLLIKTLIVTALSIGSLNAHPHNWVDLKSSFVLDDQGNLVQIKQRWQFDTFYSLITLADIVNQYGSEEMGLPLMAEVMVQNLSGFHYFSSLTMDDSKLSIGTPQQYTLTKKSKDDQVALELEMVFNLTSPVTLKGHSIQWQVFDPTYYVAMNHSTENEIEIDGQTNTVCTKELKIPKPSEDLIKYAQSLDKDMKASDGLGAKFAERTIIQCS